MWIAVRSSYEPNYVARLIDENVESRLERIKGVSELLVVGGSDREVQVRLDPEALVAYGVRIDEALAAISRGNMNLRGGTVETDRRQIVVRTIGRAEEAEQLGNRIVKETAGGAVYLDQVAEVVDTYREKSGFVNISGQPGIAIGVLRQSGANVVDVIREVDEQLELSTRASRTAAWTCA